MADLDADVLYLAMLEVLIRWGIDLIHVFVIGCVQPVSNTNPDVALAFQQRALKWAADHNTPV